MVFSIRRTHDHSNAVKVISADESKGGLFNGIKALSFFSRQSLFEETCQTMSQPGHSAHHNDVLSRIGQVTTQASPNDLLVSRQKHCANQLNELMHCNPFIILDNSDYDEIFEILSDPDINDIAGWFELDHERDLLINLQQFLSLDRLGKALKLLISNHSFRFKHYDELRQLIHHLPSGPRVDCLNKLDDMARELDDQVWVLTNKTLKLRDYSQSYQLNRYDLSMTPIVSEGFGIRLLTGSDYLFEGLIKYLNQTKDANDHFHMIMHEYLDGEFTRSFNQLLIKKHNQGVNIKLIFCQGGSWQWSKYNPFHSPPDSQIVNELIEAGIQVRVHPVSLGLEHEKGVIYKANGKIGMMMGGGTVCDQTAYPPGGPRNKNQRDALGFLTRDKQDIPQYYDLMMEAQGKPAIVWQNIFFQKWLYLGGEVCPELNNSQLLERYFSEDIDIEIDLGQKLSNMGGEASVTFLYNVPVTNPMAHPHILNALQEAKKSIYIEIPYLLLEDVLRVCKHKALNGVSVNYLLPGESPRFAEWVTNLAMSHWCNDHVELNTLDIRLCKNRYNHGKLITIDIEDDEDAVGIVMTGNLEPIISGGKKGSFVYDSTCILKNMNQCLLTDLRGVISRDFSDAFSVSIDKEHLDNQTYAKTYAAKLLHHKLKLFQ